MGTLKPEEIRLLSKLHKHSVVTGKTHEQEVKLFFENGLLQYSDFRFELGKCTIPELKQIAADNGICVRGKKAEIIENILAFVSDDALMNLQLEKYFILTAKGENIIKENSALLLWYNGLRREKISPAEVLAAQDEYKGESDYEILRHLYEKRIEKSENDFETFVLLLDLKRIFQWEHNEQKMLETEEKLAEYSNRLDTVWQERYKEHLLTFEKVFGLTKVEREEIRNKALTELDDNWEKELDEYYRKQAGGV